MESSSSQEKHKLEDLKHESYQDTDQDFNSAEDSRKISSRILPYANGNEEMDNLAHSQPTTFGYLSREMSTNRKFALAEYKDMDDSPGPLLSSEDKRHSDVESDMHYRTPQQLKKTMNQRKRVIKKGGFTNVTYKNISKKKRRYISDLYTTLLDSPWTYLVVMFAASFYLSWLFFATIYYVIAYMHGDFEALEKSTKDWVPCILEVDGFPAAFLFSLETQHTIGYGTRQTTTKCPDAMIIMSLQSVLGCLIQAFMVGLVFSKLSRPSSRSKTVIFSQNAVVNIRNKRLCLIFRIGDLRDDNFILGTQISAKIMRRRITQEGELFQEMQMMEINPSTANEPCIFFVWPLEIVHVIDENSPLYDMSAADMAKERFEIIVVMEGTIETSSMTFQARTSYLPNEILWGHRFEAMTHYRKDHNKFQVNFAAFHSTYEIETPLCSSRDLDNYINSREQANKQRSRLSMGGHQAHSRGLPSVPSTIVDFSNMEHAPPVYAHPDVDVLLRHPEQRQRAYSNNSRVMHRESPRAQPAVRALSLQRNHLNQLAGSANQLVMSPDRMSIVSSHRPRDDSETSTDSSLEKTQKKKKKSKVPEQ